MRIYVSSTSLDLKDHRQAVIETLLRTGHTPVCMEYQPAAPVVPKDECMRQVSMCDAYVGMFAWRYGFIPPQCDTSITEMEYRTALECHIPVLIFLLEDNAQWPEGFRDVGVDGQRIGTLRDELKQTTWIGFFNSPDNLAKEVLASLQSLKPEDPEQKQKPNPLPIPIPQTPIMHFQDREAELLRLREYLTNTDLRMVLICGRGGAGKTSLIIKLLHELIDKGFSTNAAVVESIVYVPLVEPQNRFPERIVELIARTLEHNAAVTLRDIWSQQHIPLSERLALLFNGPLARHRCLIILDNLESVMGNNNQVREECAALRKFIDAFFDYDHAALLIVTSRRALSLSPNIEIAAIRRKIQISLEEGLPERFAIALLRELDCDDEHPLGIRNAQDGLLGNIARRCQCIPRTLETIVAVLLQKSTWTLETLMANESYLTTLIEHPAKELYASLSSDQERLVMQALAAYDKPVPGAAIRSVLPALPIDEILDKLVSNFVATYDHGQFFLHQIDRQYAYSHIPDEGSDYSKSVFHKLAARYYQTLSIPSRGNRASLDDVMPILNAIDHLMAAGEANDAAALLIHNGLHEDLYWWGHFLLLQDLFGRLLKNPIMPKQRITLSIPLGKIERDLGNHEQAKRIYESALPFIREAADPISEISLLVALGDISYYLGNHDCALEYLHRAEGLLAVHPHPLLQSECTGDLGNVMWTTGKYEKAQRYYEQAIAFSHDAGSRIYEGIWNGDLANVQCSLFDESRDSELRESAVSFYLKAIEIAKEMKDRRHVSHWNGVLGGFYCQLGESRLAEAHLREALSISEAIYFRRMIDTQVKQLDSVFGERIQGYVQQGDLAAAVQVGQAYRQVATEIGSVKLKARADRRIITLFFQQGRIAEAVAESQQLLMSTSGGVETWSNLGAICMYWGRQAGNEAIFTLSADAYTKAIGVSPDDSVYSLFEERGNAYAMLGKLEQAIADYREVIRRQPQSIGAALSLGEVQIWAGRYGESRVLLEALIPQLRTPEETMIGNWLMCHALNCEGRDVSEYKTVIEDAAKKDFRLNYNVRDIEPYLQRLDPVRFSEKQIQNAWIIQTLIRGCEFNAGS